MKVLKNIWRLTGYRFLLFLSVLGPGLISAVADNDAGGIATYSVAGAHFGYQILWVLLLCVFSLFCVQEMCVRMGIVTGKGLSDLIREEFGVRWALFAVVALFVANGATLVGNFAGLAAALEIFGLSRFFFLPVVCAILWVLIVKGSYRVVEKVFLLFACVFLAYPATALIVSPPWGKVLRHTFVPSVSWNSEFLYMALAVVGTTVTPWMQFVSQSMAVEKGLHRSSLKYARWDVLLGIFITQVVAFFVVVTCAATLFQENVPIHDAQTAALALKPLVGERSTALFAAGLFGASCLGAGILTLSTSYAFCEAFGLESGVGKRFSQAPVFFTLCTVLLLSSMFVVLFSPASLLHLMLLSQGINGILLPVVLVFILLLANNPRVMGEFTNSVFFNGLAYLTIAFVILITVSLCVTMVVG